jgi:hypothetical protein
MRRPAARHLAGDTEELRDVGAQGPDIVRAGAPFQAAEQVSGHLYLYLYE